MKVYYLEIKNIIFENCIDAMLTESHHHEFRGNGFVIYTRMRETVYASREKI